MVEDRCVQILSENANYNSKSLCPPAYACILLFLGIHSLLFATQFLL